MNVSPFDVRIHPLDHHYKKQGHLLIGRELATVLIKMLEHGKTK
jgi:hypothetical protein